MRDTVKANWRGVRPGLDRPVRGIRPNIGPLEPFVDKVGVFNLLRAPDTETLPTGAASAGSAPGVCGLPLGG